MSETIKPTAKKPTLNERLAVIQKELKAPKNQFNKFGNFNYRSCEDILEAVKPLLGDLVLTTQDEIVHFPSTHDPIVIKVVVKDTKGNLITKDEVVSFDRFYVKSTATLTDGEKSISVSAYAREADTKAGMDVAQITGASSSYARKYALNGLFLIDDTQDADTKDNSVKETADTKAVKTPTTPTTPKTPETPKTPTTPTNYPASPNQLAWVDKILRGRGDRLTNDQLKKLSSATASLFISGKITSEELFKTIGVVYKHEGTPLLDDLDISEDK